MDQMDVPDLELHGLIMHNGTLRFYCDPGARDCRIETWFTGMSCGA